MSEKLIVVLGATGNQGGSVVTTFLEDAAWKVRGITRNKSSAKAQSLEARGVQVVEADMSRPTGLEAAFDGASAIFAVSDFMGIYFDPALSTTPEKDRNECAAEQESQQLKNVIDQAAKTPTLERFVLSSLSNVAKWSRGKYTHVYHFDGKANAEAYGREQYPELWSKTSIFQGGLYLDIYKTQKDRPSRTADGKVQFLCPWNPDMKIPWLAAAEDTGPFVQALVHSDPGKSLLAYREWATMPEVVAIFARVTGLQCTVKVLPTEEWAAAFSPDLAVEMIEFFKYWDEFGFEAQDDPPIVHPNHLQTVGQVDDIAEWVGKQDWSIILDSVKAN
ncbi:hypothetical protein LTR17_020771 [Elasticomyces elasticus]|nr:hypothetical protein LTR17_020771 [Elasticomyces elasticus]